MSPENSRKWRSNFWNADGCGTPQTRLEFRWNGFESEIEYAIAHSPSLLLAIPTDLRRQLDKKFLHSAVTLIDGLIGVCRILPHDSGRIPITLKTPVCQAKQNLGIPLPASTQWEIVEEAAELIKPARDELIQQAAKSEVLNNDDTSMRVLALRRAIAEEAGERTGIFTSGVVSTAEGRRIALFFTGRQHAGENLADVLKRRAAG
jgi:hypothetical protein